MMDLLPRRGSLRQQWRYARELASRLLRVPRNVHGHEIPPQNPRGRTQAPPPLLRPHGSRRVAYLINYLLDPETGAPGIGGGERYCLTLARLMRELGLEVHIFQVSSRPFQAVHLGFPVTGLGGSIPYSEFWHETCSEFTRLTRDFDHVLYHCPALASGTAREDGLLLCHGVWFDFEGFFYTDFRSRTWFRHLERALAVPARTVSVDASSVNVLRALRPSLASRVTVIPNFYDPSRFYPDPSRRAPGRLRVLFPRRADLNRGSRWVERMLRLVPHDVEFLWVGDGDPLERGLLERLARRDPRLKLDFASFDGMPARYQGADITVIPTAASEGTSLSALEALACGSAVIATWVGGLPEILRDEGNGLLVDPSPDAVAAAIRRLVEDEPLRRRLQEAGPASAVPFELARWKTRWTGLLRELDWIPRSAIEARSPLPRLGILTRNAIHGGVESVVAAEARLLQAEVVVVGGHEEPSCPFPHARADSPGELEAALKAFDLVLYHAIPAWAVEAVADSGVPAVEFVHRADFSDSDKAVPRALLTHSRFLAGSLRPGFAGEIAIAPHPIDASRFTPPEEPGRWVGGLTSYAPTKGLDVFLRAWALVGAEFPGLAVRFYGSGPEREPLAALARELGIAAEFLPPAKDPERALRDFRLVVMPSRLEGMPVSALEALAAGIPVLSSDLPGAREFNELCVLRGYPALLRTAPPEDPEALARALREALASPPPPSRSYIERFHSPQLHVDAVRAALESAAGLRRPPAWPRHPLVEWRRQDHPARAADGDGCFRVGGGGDSSPCTHESYPAFRVSLPRGANAVSWSASSDREAMVVWQVSWLGRRGRPLGHASDVARLFPDGRAGALAPRPGPEARAAVVTLRPVPGTAFILGDFRVRALSPRHPPSEPPPPPAPELPAELAQDSRLRALEAENAHLKRQLSRPTFVAAARLAAWMAKYPREREWTLRQLRKAARLLRSSRAGPTAAPPAPPPPGPSLPPPAARPGPCDALSLIPTPDPAALAPVRGLPFPARRGRPDIVAFSIIDWSFRYQRPQQMMSQFASHGHRVFYVYPAKFLSAGASPRFTVETLKENVFLVALAAAGTPRIYEEPVSGEDARVMLDSLAELRRELGIEEAVAYAMAAAWSPVAAAARERWGWRVLYDCMDDWDTFSGMGRALIPVERELARSCDLLVVSSRRLQLKWEASGLRPLLARNAVDFEYFADRCRPNGLLPEDVSRPVVGFYGALADWFDVDLVAELAKRRPGYTFLFIGGVFGVDVSALSALPNVRLLGQQPYETMPLYLYHFDVCLIPFKVNAVTDATDPVKLYEYLSAGKPVVSTELPELEAHRGLVRLARGADAFLAELDAAAAENDPGLRARRADFARRNDWSERYERIERALAPAWPKVAIVVVCRDNLPFTRMCLESVLAETAYPNYELVVVDNGSTDGTSSYLRGLSRRHPRLKIVSNLENRGFAPANNQGIAACSGEYVVLLNNDVIVPPGWLNRLLAPFGDPAIGLAGPVTNYVGNEAKVEVSYRTWGQMRAYAAERMRRREGRRFEIPMLAMYCLAIRREALERIGPLDERFRIGMFEDDDYCHRARLCGYKLVCVQDAFVHHFGSASFAKLPGEEYLALFEENRRRFEGKWKMPWVKPGQIPAKSAE